MRFEHKIIETKVIKTTHTKYYAMLLLFQDEESSTKFFDEVFAEEYNGVEK